MIRLTDLGKTYGSKTALAPISVTFAEHSFTCIVGKSGCGKTTL
ncbi:MAG TPA: spermidine/putrescine ABC transporter ATP-binding protein, partial [Acidaminococcaceae bacterium]|nr:spermidine/putrescine ABC transporter ATP-binding protein [Acidaminococcaceae bacterium]